jgi:hypothetical protein
LSNSHEIPFHGIRERNDIYAGSGQSKKDSPEKLATWDTQDDEKHKTLCVGDHYAQTNIYNVNKT